MLFGLDALEDFAAGNGRWMVWNTLLALAPAVLAAGLFAPLPTRRLRHSHWWAAAAAFILLLPNAPYVLTDVIHMWDTVRAGRYTPLFTAVVVGGTYAVLFTIGMLAYTSSVMAMGAFVRSRTSSGWALAATTATHAACAVGIYLGRFLRFNSWDVLAAPGELAVAGTAMWNFRAAATCAVLFAGLAVSYAGTSRLLAAVVAAGRRLAGHHLETSS